jgi:hypothetical protein
MLFQMLYAEEEADGSCALEVTASALHAISVEGIPEWTG